MVDLVASHTGLPSARWHPIVQLPTAFHSSLKGILRERRWRNEKLSDFKDAIFQKSESENLGSRNQGATNTICQLQKNIFTGVVMERFEKQLTSILSKSGQQPSTEDKLSLVSIYGNSWLCMTEGRVRKHRWQFAWHVLWLSGKPSKH